MKALIQAEAIETNLVEEKMVGTACKRDSWTVFVSMHTARCCCLSILTFPSWRLPIML